MGSAHQSRGQAGGWGSGLCMPSARLSVPGLQRRRLIPAPLPDNAALGRKPSLPGQWVDLPPPLAGTLKEPFEIKVYEIDDVERLQRRRGGSSKVSLLHPAPPQVPLSAPQGQCLRPGTGPGHPQRLPRGWEARAAPAGSQACAPSSSGEPPISPPGDMEGSKTGRAGGLFWLQLGTPIAF